MKKAIYKLILPLLKPSIKYYNSGHVFPSNSGMNGTDNLGKWFWKSHDVCEPFLFLPSVLCLLFFLVLLCCLFTTACPPLHKPPQINIQGAEVPTLRAAAKGRG